MLHVMGTMWHVTIGFRNREFDKLIYVQSGTRVRKRSPASIFLQNMDAEFQIGLGSVAILLK